MNTLKKYYKFGKQHEFSIYCIKCSTFTAKPAKLCALYCTALSLEKSSNLTTLLPVQRTLIDLIFSQNLIITPSPSSAPYLTNTCIDNSNKNPYSSEVLEPEVLFGRVVNQRADCNPSLPHSTAMSTLKLVPSHFGLFPEA